MCMGLLIAFLSVYHVSEPLELEVQTVVSQQLNSDLLEEQPVLLTRVIIYLSDSSFLLLFS